MKSKKAVDLMGVAHTPVVIDDRELSLDEMLDVACDGREVCLSEDARWRAKIEASRSRLERAMGSGESVYGVTTGVGYSSSRRIAADAVDTFADNIVRQHGCGVGVPFTREESRGLVFARLVSLSKGYSAVRLDLLEAMVGLLNRDVIPVVPRFGSVGASGDLTPLSYLVSVLQGEREAYADGVILPAGEALKRAGLEPLRMVPKESLAIMNGTSVMTAVGVITGARLRRVLGLADRVTALAAEVLYGRSVAFHATAHAIKPHAGQVESARAIREALAGSALIDRVDEGARIVQDPYSIRCAPHVLGSARDALVWADGVLRLELNSVNDNPIVDPANGDILFAGNFYGGHVALAMDLLKIATAAVADLLDRQYALLVDSRFNMGLPESLVGYPGNGTKALQITCTALAALANQRAGSDTLTSRPTEVNNQDKVSMGLNAAINAGDVVTLLQQVMATEMIALSNAATLREEDLLSTSGQELLGEIRKRSPVLVADRRLDGEIEELVAFIDDLTGG